MKTASFSVKSKVKMPNNTNGLKKQLYFCNEYKIMVGSGSVVTASSPIMISKEVESNFTTFQDMESPFTLLVVHMVKMLMSLVKVSMLKAFLILCGKLFNQWEFALEFVEFPNVPQIKTIPPLSHNMKKTKSDEPHVTEEDFKVASEDLSSGGHLA